MVSVSRTAAPRNVPKSKSKGVERLRKQWAWLVWPASTEEDRRYEVVATWDPNSDSGVIFAAPEFWAAVQDVDADSHGDALNVLIQVRATAEAFPMHPAVQAVPEDVGAQLAPPDPVLAFKDEVAGLLGVAVTGDDSAREDLTLRYALLRERLGEMQRAVLEAEGSLDTLGAVLGSALNAPRRTGEQGRAAVQPTA